MITHDIGDFQLSFEELPLRLRLEGFPSEVAHSVAHQWSCPIRVADPVGDAYGIRLRADSRCRFRPPSSVRPPRRALLHAQTVGASTELRMSGARMRFTSRRPAAEIDVHPHLLRHPGLMEVAVGGPLGHALALTDASFLHGAAIVVQDLPILLLGGAEAGKSSVAGAALAAGGTVVSDDSLVLYSTAAGVLAVRTLRRNLFLREGSLRVLPKTLYQRLRRVGPSIDPRWELDREDAASYFRATIEPTVLCVLRKDRRLKSYRIQPLSQAGALTALLAANGSPHLLHPGFHYERQQLLELWSRLTADLPACELRLGSALLSSPEDLLGEVVTRLRELLVRGRRQPGNRSSSVG